MRATICVDLSDEDEVAAVEVWFKRWRVELAFVSENQGCGCCVDMWDVEGPDDAVSEIPASVRAASDWAGIP